MKTAAFASLLLLFVACQATPEEPEVSSQSQELGGFDGHLVLQNSSFSKQVYKGASKAWLRWAMKLPFSTGPITDATGAACAQGQSGPIWFLAGTSGGPATRNCTIPKNKLLFFPLINNWVIPPHDAVDTTDEMAEFRQFLVEYFAELHALTCNLTLRLDGHEILADSAERNAKLFVDIQDLFSVEVNADNYGSAFGKPAGVYPDSAMAGNFALLLPLSSGQHTLEFGGALCEAGEILFETSATYHLTIANP